MFFIPDFFGAIRDAENELLRQDLLKQSVEGGQYKLNDASRIDAVKALLQPGAQSQAQYRSDNTIDYVGALRPGMQQRNAALAGTETANAETGLSNALYNQNTAAARDAAYTPGVLAQVFGNEAANKVQAGSNQLQYNQQVVPSWISNQTTTQKELVPLQIGNQVDIAANVVPAQIQQQQDQIKTTQDMAALSGLRAYGTHQGPEFQAHISAAVRQLDPTAVVEFVPGQGYLIRLPSGPVSLNDFATAHSNRLGGIVAAALQASGKTPKPSAAQQKAADTAAAAAATNSALGLGPGGVPAPGSAAQQAYIASRQTPTVAAPAPAPAPAPAVAPVVAPPAAPVQYVPVPVPAGSTAAIAGLTQLTDPRRVGAAQVAPAPWVRLGG